jgi:carboxypeptidase PM20D1
MLSGSTKENVYAPEASAVLDLRLLPGQDPKAVIARLQEVMQEPAVKVEALLSSTAHSSPIDTDLSRAIAKVVARHEPGAKLTPNFIAGFTDCNTIRAAGIVCYGFMPMHLAMPEVERVHGNDERILISDFTEATLQMHELVREVAGR